MKTLSFVSCAFLFLSSAAYALPATKSIEFTPKLGVWDCPEGFHYLVIECKERETVLPPQRLEFLDAGDGFWTVDGTYKADGTLSATNHVQFMIYPNQQGDVQLLGDFSSGFETDPTRNPGAFFETPPSGFPSWLLITGERRLVKPGHEVVSTFEYADLKLTP